MGWKFASWFGFSHHGYGCTAVYGYYPVTIVVGRTRNLDIPLPSLAADSDTLQREEEEEEVGEESSSAGDLRLR